MKTKFDGIVKLRSMELDEASMNLQKLRQIANNIQEKINALKAQVSSYEVPSCGTFDLVVANRKVLNIARLQIDLTQRELEMALVRIAQARDVYENAHKECEKMKYLQQEEKAVAIKKLKRKEALELDEIALELFANKGK